MKAIRDDRIKKRATYRKPAFLLYEPKPYFDSFVPVNVAITMSASTPRIVAL